ncbi:MAG: hypothetical protein M5U26_26255 [Planctomycetota bacterium]|nr:hypothetical protein [Planctomycetota bacterium]
MRGFMGVLGSLALLCAFSLAPAVTASEDSGVEARIGCSFVESEIGDSMILHRLDYTLNWPKNPGGDSFTATGYVNLAKLIDDFGGGQQLQRGVGFDPPLVLMDLFLDNVVGVSLQGVEFYPAEAPINATVNGVTWQSVPGDDTFIRLTISPSTGFFSVTVRNANLANGGVGLKRCGSGFSQDLNDALKNVQVDAGFELLFPEYSIASVEFLSVYNQSRPDAVGRGQFRLGRDSIFETSECCDFDPIVFFVEHLSIQQRRSGDGYAQKATVRAAYDESLTVALKRNGGQDIFVSIGGYTEAIPRDSFRETPGRLILTYTKPRGAPPGIAFMQLNFETGIMTIRTDFLPDDAFCVDPVEDAKNEQRHYLVIPVVIELEGEYLNGFQTLVGRRGTTFQTGAPSVVLTPLLVVK